MSLNIKKCHHIKFTRKKKPTATSYVLHNIIIQSVTTIRDLGVVLDSNLKLLSHYDTIISKAAQMLGFVKRNTKSFGSRAKIALYNSLVRSHLEYASVVWNPVYSSSSQRIESIQRSFTRHLAHISPGISARALYDQRLDFFKMTSLHSRRTMLDMVFLHKILNGGLDCSGILANLRISVPRKLPRFPITRSFNITKCRTNLALHAPLSRMSIQYNRLCAECQELDIFHDPLSIFRKKVTAII